MIEIQATINAPIDKVWECWTSPGHITGWAFATDEWEAKDPENDLRVGGKFKTTMTAKDPSTGSGQAESFDFEGVYDAVVQNKLIQYTMTDERHVKVEFLETSDPSTGSVNSQQASSGQVVQILETFEPEEENSLEMQQQGWQAILDNFKKYVEGLN